MTAWHALGLEQLERDLDTGDVGLSQRAAAERLREQGPNEIVEPPPTPGWVLFLRQFKSPLIYLLLAATVVTFLLGRTNDSTVIAVVLLINAIVGFVQERRAEASVRALKKLVASHTRVVRDGVEQEITFFLLCTAAAEILAVLGAQALGWPIPFLPVQLLWLNLVTNGIQDLALAFEPRDQDILEQPPRARSAGILSGLLWERMIVAGVVMAAGTLFLFRLELLAGSSIVRAQTIALTTMVLFQMFQVGMARSERRSAFVKSPFSNRALLAGTILATALHAAVMTLPFSNRLLHLEPVDPWTWLKMLLIAASIIPAMELHKLIRARWALPERHHRMRVSPRSTSEVRS